MILNELELRIPVFRWQLSRFKSDNELRMYLRLVLQKESIMAAFRKICENYFLGAFVQLAFIRSDLQKKLESNQGNWFKHYWSWTVRPSPLQLITKKNTSLFYKTNTVSTTAKRSTYVSLHDVWTRLPGTEILLLKFETSCTKGCKTFVSNSILIPYIVRYITRDTNFGNYEAKVIWNQPKVKIAISIYFILKLFKHFELPFAITCCIDVFEDHYNGSQWKDQKRLDYLYFNRRRNSLGDT